MILFYFLQCPQRHEYGATFVRTQNQTHIQYDDICARTLPTSAFVRYPGFPQLHGQSRRIRR